MAASSRRSVRIVRSVSSAEDGPRVEKLVLFAPRRLPAEPQQRLALVPEGSSMPCRDRIRSARPCSSSASRPRSARRSSAAQRLLSDPRRGKAAADSRPRPSARIASSNRPPARSSPPVFQEEPDLPDALVVDGDGGGERNAERPARSRGRRRPRRARRGVVAATSASARGRFDCGPRAAEGRSARDGGPRPGSPDRRSVAAFGARHFFRMSRRPTLTPAAGRTAGRG